MVLRRLDFSGWARFTEVDGVARGGISENEVSGVDKVPKDGVPKGELSGDEFSGDEVSGGEVSSARDLLIISGWSLMDAIVLIADELVSPVDG